MINHFYEDIPGWFNFQDIYREAVERARDGAIFVEVGTWLGRSAAFMATEIANSGKQISFYCVDTWNGSPAPQYQELVAKHGGSVYHAFLENMHRGGLLIGDQFHTLISDSAEAAATSFLDDSIDLVFIDGAHDFHSVSRDVKAWLPRLAFSRGGLIAGHDANCPGLMNAVKQWIPACDIEYRGTSWLRDRMGRHSAAFYAGEFHVGVIDESLEEWAVVDYDRRRKLAFLADDPGVPATVPPPTPPDRYIAKWGGPPGAETFEFPYGITTKDW